MGRAGEQTILVPERMEDYRVFTRNRPWITLARFASYGSASMRDGSWSLSGVGSTDRCT